MFRLAKNTAWISRESISKPYLVRKGVMRGKFGSMRKLCLHAKTVVRRTREDQNFAPMR